MNKRANLTLWTAGSLMLSLLLMTIASAEVSPIKINLVSSKTSYLAVEPIKMQIKVYNDSGQNVICRKGYFDQDFHLKITFIDPDGKPINSKYLQAGKEPGPPLRVEDINGVERDSALAEIIPPENPGNPNTYRLIVIENAREFYDLPKAGRYTAQVFTSLETFEDSTQYPDTGELFGFLDSAHSFTPSSNMISLEIASAAPGQQLAILQPNGAEIIPSGSNYAIRWVAPSNAVKFDLKYSMNNGTAWKPIANKVTGTSYNWTVPIPKSNKKKCLVKIIGYNASNMNIGEDKSDGKFTIEVIKVISPNVGETLNAGTTWNITWQTNGTVSPVAFDKIYYTYDGGATWKFITPRYDNLGYYPWEVPFVPSVKNKCKVKVVLKDASGVTVGKDISDGFFTIQP